MTHRPRFVMITSLLATGPATARHAVLTSWKYGVYGVSNVSDMYIMARRAVCCYLNQRVLLPYLASSSFFTSFLKEGFKDIGESSMLGIAVPFAIYTLSRRPKKCSTF